jgi:sodium/potassium/calcium exchanger 6
LCTFSFSFKSSSVCFILIPKLQGVTFLAYGNGAPDIFSAVAGFVDSHSTGNLALSALIGEYW